VKVINALSQGLESAPERPAGYRRSSKQIGPLLGAHALGATIYELAPRESICPYHYEYGNEEWLIVLSGEPTLRTPDGQHTLEPGDAVCFREGPDGAHKVTKRGRRPRARADALDDARTVDLRLPGQRQGRRLAAREAVPRGGCGRLLGR
jgi:uncharacterized cupin superfamily protein